jgi:hypothetical protein
VIPQPGVSQSFFVIDLNEKWADCVVDVIPSERRTVLVRLSPTGDRGRLYLDSYFDFLAQQL